MSKALEVISTAGGAATTTGLAAKAAMWGVPGITTSRAVRAAGSLATGRIGLAIAAATMLPSGAYRGWQAYRRGDELGEVAKATLWGMVGVDSAEAQGRQPNGQPYADPGRGLTHSYGNGPRLPNRPAPAKVESPPAVAQPTPAPPPSTVDAVQLTAQQKAREQERQLLRETLKLQTDIIRKEALNSSSGPLAKLAQERYEKALKRLVEIDAIEAKENENKSMETASWRAPAIGAAALVAGTVIGTVVARRTGLSQRTLVAGVNALGAQAARLSKAKGVLTGTPKGDVLKGVVSQGEAAAAKLAVPAAGAFRQPMNWVTAGLAAEGGASIAYSFMTDDPYKQAMFRNLGAASLGLVGGIKVGQLIGKAGVPTVEVAAMAGLKSGKARLARESAGGAMKASKHRIAVEVAGAKGQRVGAEAATKIGGVKAGQAVQKAGVTGPAAPRISKAAQAREAARRSASGKQAAASRAAKLEAGRKGAFELGKARGGAEAMQQIATPAALGQRARELGVRGRSAMSVHELRSAVAKADVRRRVRGQGVHRGGRGFANPKVQAAAQRAQRHKYTGLAD